MSRLDFPASGEALWAIYDAGGPRPEYLLPILMRESSLLASASNGYAHGLNQVSTAWLTARGIDVEDYIHHWLPSQQLARIVRGYELIHVAQFGPINSGIRCYAMNFLPASVRDGKTALSDVLAVKGTAFYNDNSGLDANNDGQITVGDLAYVVYAQFQGDNPGIDRGPHVRDAIARTYELRPMERVHDPVYGDDYPLPYLTGNYGDMAAGISAMLAKGLTRIFSKAKI